MFFEIRLTDRETNHCDKFKYYTKWQL